MTEGLEKVEIKKVIGPTSAGAAILLGNADKTFVVFIGFHEAAAVVRELKEETAARPLTHDLVQSVFLGFDLEIKQIVISDIIDNAFCATLILEQKVNNSNGEWVGRRNEVRIDARPSDCLVLALKNKSDIYVTREVFDQVQDFSELSQEENPWLAGEGLIDEDFSDRPGREIRGAEESLGAESFGPEKLGPEDFTDPGEALDTDDVDIEEDEYE